MKRGLEAGAAPGNEREDRESDARCNQPILDGGRPGFIIEESSQSPAHVQTRNALYIPRRRAGDGLSLLFITGKKSITAPVAKGPGGAACGRGRESQEKGNRALHRWQER